MFIYFGTHTSFTHICSSIWGHIPPSSIYVHPFRDTSLPHPYMFIHLGTHPASSICVHPFGDTSLPHPYIFIHLGTHPASSIYVHPFSGSSSLPFVSLACGIVELLQMSGVASKFGARTPPPPGRKEEEGQQSAGCKEEEPDQHKSKCISFCTKRKSGGLND